MKKVILIGVITVLFSLLIRLYFGIYIHDEFGDKCYFIKHKATWKWKFYSPIGQSDLKMEDLSLEKQIEQKYFNEFVSNQGMSK